jgi:hypothetical protein
MSRQASIGCGVASLAVWSLLAWFAQAVAETIPRSNLVPLVNPIGIEKSGPQPQGLFRRIVTARGAEIDDGRAGLHPLRPVGITDTFPPDAPSVYVVVELFQPTFADFRLIGRFILEDPDGRPIGTVLSSDKAQLENEDTGGYLLMKKPPGGFPLGNYRVEIHYEAINEISLLAVARFKVVSNP